MRTKNRLLTNLTVGFLGACVPLGIGCSGEETPSGTGGAAGSGAGMMSTGGSVTGGTSTGGTATGGTATGGTATGGSPTGGSGGSGVTGGSGGSSAGAGNGGSGMGGSTGGSAGASMGGAGSGGMPGGSGGSGPGGAGSGGSSTGGFTLTSPDHMNGAMFADPYTCAEAGFMNSILPELHWSGAPAGTMSFAITFIDRTLAAQNMTNAYHWAIWNIPASTMMLPEGFVDQTSIGAQETGNYLGPCPNIAGSGNTDTYEFTIYALAQASITVMGSSTTAVRNAETALEASNLGKAKLSGTSSASPP